MIPLTKEIGFCSEKEPRWLFFLLLKSNPFYNKTFTNISCLIFSIAGESDDKNGAMYQARR